MSSVYFPDSNSLDDLSQDKATPSTALLETANKTADAVLTRSEGSQTSAELAVLMNRASIEQSPSKTQAVGYELFSGASSSVEESEESHPSFKPEQTFVAHGVLAHGAMWDKSLGELVAYDVRSGYIRTMRV